MMLIFSSTPYPPLSLVICTGLNPDGAYTFRTSVRLNLKPNNQTCVYKCMQSHSCH